MLAARSTTGCWTCRLRKKKCDEIHPTCNSCSSRNLTCFGYKEKPFWMDGGVVEERELANIQEAVRQSYSFRRAARAKYPLSLTSHIPMQEGHATNELEELPQEPAHDPYVAVPTSSDLATNNILSTLIPSTEYTSILKRQQDSVADPSTDDESSQQPNSSVSEITEEFNPVQIMYYFDNVFPLQHHFYRPSTPDAGRGWLLNLLFRNKCLYLSALAMNALHQNLFRDVGNVENERQSMRELEWYHSRTISELHREVKNLSTLNGLDHLKHGLPILASMIQLVSFEVLREYKHFKGNRGDWEVHLEGAGALISLIDSEIMNTRGQAEETRLESQSRTVIDSTSNNSLPIPDIYPPEDITGIDFLRTVYAWADILRYGSIGWRGPNTLANTCERYVEEEHVQLGPEMGCCNWAMISIIKIARLEAWIDKRRHLGESTPSEVCRQAALIEDYLRGGRVALGRKSEPLISYEKERRLVTEIYGISALIYLYIVISGVVPTPPELAACVSEALATLQAITPDRLVAVSWPFCVAGCMAVGDERDAFRQVVLSAVQSGTQIGTTMVALEIMEEAWKLRWHPNNSEVDGVCWWRASMQTLGFKTLLI